MIRIDAILAIGAVTEWLALVFMLDVMALPTPEVVRPAQAPQQFDVVAITPAILDLLGAAEHRAGWRRVVMVSPLLIGLTGMA